MKIFFRIFKTFLLLALAVGLIWLGGFGWFAFKATTMHPYDLQQKAGAIVVLTGGEGRMDAGLNLFAAERGLYLFITGIYEQVDEADVRKRWKGETPLPICCIILDHQAASTAQNALMTREWINSFATTSDGESITSIRLVTSNYHMPRALVDFKRLLPGIIIYPHPVISPNATTWNKVYWVLLVHEYHKYLFRTIQQYLPPKWQEAMA